MKNLKEVIAALEGKKIFTRDGKLHSFKYRVLRYAVYIDHKVYYNVVTQGKYYSCTSHLTWISDLLTAAGFEFTAENDDIRRRRSGDHLKISKEASDFLRSLL